MQTSTNRIQSFNRPRYKYDEYLALESFSNVKHEYLDGVIRSLRQYVLVSHREHSLVVWTRGDDDRWQSAALREGAIAELPSIEARLDVRELYAAAAEPSR